MRSCRGHEEDTGRRRAGGLSASVFLRYILLDTLLHLYPSCRPCRRPHPISIPRATRRSPRGSSCSTRGIRPAASSPSWSSTRSSEIVFRPPSTARPRTAEPAATGWAAERVGDGEVNAVACLENTETSAIGRALANLGFLASRLRSSAEEVAKVDRARARLGGRARPAAAPRTAERAGLSATRGARRSRARVGRGLPRAGAGRGAARAPALHPATDGGPRGAGGAGGVSG